MLGKRYESMDQKEANLKCSSQFSGGYFTNCPECRHRIMLHCKSCNIQTTGCVCTARERMTPEEFESFMKQREDILKGKQ